MVSMVSSEQACSLLMWRNETAVKGRGGISGLGSSGWWAYVGEFHPNGNIVHPGTVTIEKGHIF